MKGEEASATKRMTMAPVTPPAHALAVPCSPAPSPPMPPELPIDYLQHSHAHENVGCAGCDLGLLHDHESQFFNAHDHSL
eukprot:6291301-Prymnesium_polylepis.1